jgi:hypothetical protein
VQFALQNAASAVRAAQIALAGLQEEALTGTRTVLDVLVAEQQLFTTQAQLFRDADVIAQNAGTLGDRKPRLRVDPPCQHCPLRK